MKKMFTLGALALIMFSCKKEKPNSSLDQNDPAKLQQVEAMAMKDANLDFFAKHLAASLSKTEMRQFIKNEALKKFDGDYDILFDLVKSQDINGKAFQNQLATNRSSNSEDAGLLSNIKFIASSSPLLNISVPANIEKWNTETFIPFVAIIASDYDEKTPKQIKAYDSNGKIHWLDPKKMPEFPVIAVGINERSIIDASGQVHLKKNYSHSAINQISAELPPDDGGGGGGTGTGTLCRIDGQKEYIDAITFPGSYLQTMYEDWVLGAPELKVAIFKPINNFTELGEFYSTTYEPENRSDVNDNWDHFYGTWPLFNWFNADYGNIVIYKWIEEDSGSIFKIDIKATISGVELKGTLDIHNYDDEILTTPVDQRDCDAVKIYGPPSFKFEIKHQ